MNIGILFPSSHYYFNFFTRCHRTLDIICDYLDWKGYLYMRLDGGTNRVMREVNVKLFNRPQSAFQIFTLSTRAGGEGVNLATADTVILFDSDWNPQVDIQAMARVHRIGQTKTVHVYRYVLVPLCMYLCMCMCNMYIMHLAKARRPCVTNLENFLPLTFWLLIGL